QAARSVRHPGTAGVQVREQRMGHPGLADAGRCGSVVSLKPPIVAPVTADGGAAGTPAVQPADQPPAIDPAKVATFQNGKLLLTPEGFQLFSTTVLNTDWAGDKNSRTTW